MPRAAVRLLHAGLHHHDHRVPRREPEPTAAEAREAISGNLCRCTGYQNIVAAVLRAASWLAATARRIGRREARRSA